MPLRGEEPSLSMHEFNHGAPSVQRPTYGNAQVGVPVDFQCAKLDRRVFLRRTQEQSEQSLRRQPTERVGILAAMDQHDEFAGG